MGCIKAFAAIFFGVLLQQASSESVSSRHTTLATFNAGFVVGSIGNVDARASVLIDQVSVLIILRM